MKRALALMLVFTTIGCAALRPAERIDTMRLAPAFTAATVRRSGSVVVAPVEAAGAVADRRYVYVLMSDPLLLRQAATLFWELPPPATVGRALADAVQARYTAGPVVGRLSTRLVRFEEMTGGGQARAIVAIDASFDPVASGAKSTARYCRAVPIAASGSGDRAAAFQASVAAVATAVAADVASAGTLASSGC